jgi:cathepsin L
MRNQNYQKLFVFASFLLALFSAVVLAQRPITRLPQKVDYELREKNASPEIKTKLATLRTNIKNEKFTFTVGYTEAMDRNLENLTGDIIPTDMANRARTINLQARQLLEMDDEAQANFIKLNPNKIPRLTVKCSAGLKAFDWRKSGKVTGVRDQMSCGSCWSFAVIGALESSYLIRNNSTTDESEQYVLANSGAGSCAGGNRQAANSYLVSTGTASETVIPYTATSGPPNPGAATPYDAVATGFVNAAVENPSVAELKQALCEYGPLSVSVNATSQFQAYTGGVFNQMSNASTNHAVLLIGWDDAKGAWLIKNSWGSGWGSTADYGTEKGYMWIAYNSNRIGRWAQWIKAKSKYYILPARYYEIVKKPMIIDPVIIRQPIKNND